MNYKIKCIGVIFCLTVASISGNAEIILPKILGNNMVLQRNQPVPIWGSASAGEHIIIDFNKQHKTVTADAAGHWRVSLDAMPASASPADLRIQGSNSITLTNILIGEVWLCSGQSNMEYTMRKNSKVMLPDSSIDSPVKELERAKNTSIRIFLVTNKNLRVADPAHTGWSVARDSALRPFSAPAYFFAKELYSKLGVPVGVISAAVPGSDIEPWLYAKIELSTTAPFTINKDFPGKFYPVMIQPLAPFAIKGFLWYQGETNCFQNETVEYTSKMQVLIEGWRKLWADDKLPFYYVQIAPYYYSKSAGKYPLTTETLPRFWEAQALALQIPNTGMITITDLVNSPDDLHPGYKWEVGRRLALLALARTYKRQVIYSGPVFKQMKILKNSLELSFDHIGTGLVSRNGKPLSSFIIAGENNIFVSAVAVIKDNKVIVSSARVEHPKNVRFEWDETGNANLFNKDGLPAVPFRTDTTLHLRL